MGVSKKAVAGSHPREGSGPLRIAFVVDRFPSLSETFILNQITGLLERGHTVDIFATHQSRAAVVHADVERYGLVHRTRNVVLPQNLFTRAVKGAGLLAVHAPRHPALLRALNVARYGRSAIALHMLYTGVPFLTPYDIVHCQYGTNGEAVGAVLKELGLQRRLVTTFHGEDLRLVERRGAELFRRLLRQGDCFIAISDYSRRRLLELGIDPAKLVHHPVGIDCSVFTRAAQPSNGSGRDLRIVTVARLVPEKAIHVGILAVSKVLRDQPDLRLRYEIVGDGPMYGELTTLICDLGLEGVIRLRGPLQQEAVVDILRRSDIFVLPSVAEVLPVALMEAQAVGLPAVATAVGGTSEIVLDGRSGFLVPPGDLEALAEKLQLLIHQPRLRIALGELGSRHVMARFDVNGLNDRLIQIYRRVIGGNLPIEKRDIAWTAETTPILTAFAEGESIEAGT